MTDKIEKPVAYLYRNESADKELLLDCNGEHARRLLELGYTETPLFAALRTQRNEVVEECARVAERVFLPGAGYGSAQIRSCRQIATAIRNLKSQDEPR